MAETPVSERKIMGETPPKAKLTRKENPTAEMSFLEHLEELRWRLIKGIIGLLVGVGIASLFSEFIISEILLGPTKADFIVYQLLGFEAQDLALQSRRLPGQFFTYWGVLFVCGAIMGSPVFFYQLFAFIEPALEAKQKIKSFFAVASITLLFLTGVSFGYFVLTSFAVQYFATFTIDGSVQNLFDINAYFSSLSVWVLASGGIFQMPVVSYFLARAGILTPQFLKKYRKQAIVLAFVIGAFLTPPDPVSQALMAIPLIGLYQFAIWIARIANKKHENEIWGKDGPPK